MVPIPACYIVLVLLKASNLTLIYCLLSFWIFKSQTSAIKCNKLVLSCQSSETYLCNSWETNSYLFIYAWLFAWNGITTVTEICCLNTITLSTKQVTTIWLNLIPLASHYTRNINLLLIVFVLLYFLLIRYIEMAYSKTFQPYFYFTGHKNKKNALQKWRKCCDTNLLSGLTFPLWMWLSRSL